MAAGYRACIPSGRLLMAARCRACTRSARLLMAARCRACTRSARLLIPRFCYTPAPTGGLMRHLAFVFSLFVAATSSMAQTPVYRAPRLNGHPDLNGIWQAMNTANWDLIDHPAQPGPLWQTGAIG